MTKPKTTQPKTQESVQGRDTFYTPNYGTDLIVPFITGNRIWESASGSGKMAGRLVHHGFTVFESDLIFGQNFFEYTLDLEFDAIVTNPPFSLKREFYNRCKSFEKPFALLIPLDFCGWILRAMKDDGSQWLAPTRRIDYITPTGRRGKDSHSQFHSGWFCFGMELPEQITIVELTNKMKENV